MSPIAMAARMYVCESAEHPSILLTGLNEQRHKGLLCDVTVRVQGHLFKAHVNVLASTMGYFRDLFCKPSMDKMHGVIDIPMIVNTTGFAKVLDFVYTSQLCLSQNTVMEVLCSACYLQIPYVVEKCQEFISSHGSATPAGSNLPAAAGNLLQNLQRNGIMYSKSQSQSASASLSLLSQLSRSTNNNNIEKQAEYNNKPPQQQSRKCSPQRLPDDQQQQECELINTPPSPGEHSLNNSDGRPPSPNSESGSGNGGSEVITGNGMGAVVKREPTEDFQTSNVKVSSSNEKPLHTPIYTPDHRSRYSQLMRKSDNHMSQQSEQNDLQQQQQQLVTQATRRYLYNNNNNIHHNSGSQQQPPVNGTSTDNGYQDAALFDVDSIDHKSLAEYFSNERKEEYAMTDLNHRQLTSYYFDNGTGNTQPGCSATFGSQDHPLTTHSALLTTASANSHQPRDSSLAMQPYTSNHFSYGPKKEKPKKEYKCEYCNKLFGRQQHLKRHILTHTGERPYPCTFCDKRFRRSEHLKHHLVSHDNPPGFAIPPGSRKRQRRTEREDAYSLSRLLLDYNQPTSVDNVTQLSSMAGTFVSTPVVLPSMCADRSSSVVASEQSQSNGLDNVGGATIHELDDGVDNPDSGEIMTSASLVLNLSRSSNLKLLPHTGSAVSAGDNSHLSSPVPAQPVAQIPEQEDRVGGDGHVMMEAMERDEGSPSSASANSDEMNTSSGGDGSARIEASMISMEGSEVLTSDLKRLIAAMDE